MIDLAIGIDPGTQQSGLAIYDLRKKVFTKLEYYKLWDLFDEIVALNNTNKGVFFVENSNLIKGNWHGSRSRGQVGKNKSISQNIVDYCRHIGVDLEELKPEGYSRYFSNHKDFIDRTDYQGKSNKDTRAAAAMILGNQLLIRARQ